MNRQPTTSVVAGGLTLCVPAQLAVGSILNCVCPAHTPPWLARQACKAAKQKTLLLQAFNNAGAPFLRCKSKVLYVADGLPAAQVLGHQIGGVELTKDLFQRDAPFTSQVLKPQVGNLQMSYLLQSCSLADSFARAAVCEHTDAVWLLERNGAPNLDKLTGSPSARWRPSPPRSTRLRRCSVPRLLASYSTPSGKLLSTSNNRR